MLNFHSNRLIKLLSWLLFLYILIGVLHGIAPGIWGKSFGGLENKGPFRILFFTPTIFVLFYIAISAEIIKISLSPIISSCYFKELKYSPPRRGPPLPS